MSLYYRTSLTLSYPSLEETLGQGALVEPEMQPRWRGRPQKDNARTIPTSREGVHDETRLLDQELPLVIPLLDITAEMQLPEGPRNDVVG